MARSIWLLPAAALIVLCAAAVNSPARAQLPSPVKAAPSTVAPATVAHAAPQGLPGSPAAGGRERAATAAPAPQAIAPVVEYGTIGELTLGMLFYAIPKLVCLAGAILAARKLWQTARNWQGLSPGRRAAGIACAALMFLCGLAAPNMALFFVMGGGCGGVVSALY